jgi:hypothetical protein
VAELPAPFQKTALEGARRRVADKGLAFLPQTKTRTGNIVLDEEGLRQAFRDTLGLSIYNQLGGRKTCARQRLTITSVRRRAWGNKVAGARMLLPRR